MVELVANQTKYEDCISEDAGCVDYLNSIFIEAVQKTSCEQLPQVPNHRRKPWISVETYELLERTIHARQSNKWEDTKIKTTGEA